MPVKNIFAKNNRGILLDVVVFVLQLILIRLLTGYFIELIQRASADDYEKEKELTRQLMVGEIGDYSLEKRYLCKDEHIVWGRMTATIVRKESGEPFYMLAIIEDITEGKRAEEELKKLNEQLEGRVAERTVALSTAICSTAFFRMGLLRAFSGKSVSIGGALNLAYWSMTACASESNGMMAPPQGRLLSI